MEEVDLAGQILVIDFLRLGIRGGHDDEGAPHGFAGGSGQANGRAESCGSQHGHHAAAGIVLGH